MTPDGQTIYLPSFEKEHWHVVDAMTGDVIARIVPNSGAHNTIVGLDGRHAYLAGLRSPLLTVADTESNTISRHRRPVRGADPAVHDRRPADALLRLHQRTARLRGRRPAQRPRSWPGSRSPGFEPGPVKRHGCPSHGIGLTPDEREVWVVDGHNQRVHIFDNTTFPPEQVESIAVRDEPGWITFSLDGALAWPSTGDVIDTESREVIAHLTDETGAAVMSEKMVEVHVLGGEVVRHRRPVRPRPRHRRGPLSHPQRPTPPPGDAPMTHRPHRLAATAATALALGLLGHCQAAPVPVDETPTGWTKHAINDKSPFEAAAAFDVDGDGTPDVVSGDRWYRGPDFDESYKVRDVGQTGTYRNCFATLPVDVNDDGRTDYVTVSYFDRNVGWVENPGEAGAPWTYHEIDLPGPSEAAWLVDLTGDGVPDVLPNTVNVAVFYELKDAGPDAEWKKYELGTAEAGHGVGTGDVNGDGRTDLLTPHGWFEAPADPAADSWAFHPEWDLGAAGIQILARDVDRRRPR